jgi:hypothetical protein
MVVAACAASIATSGAAELAPRARPGQLPSGFSSADAQVNRTKLHYVRGGAPRPSS